MTLLLKVLIVDDEPKIRNGLKALIDWEKCGFSLCGEAENGKDALDKILELKPHLVITDIKMPGMDGLQMIGEITRLGIKSSVIILTGHSDFEYAQKALEYGVDSYILKPIDEEKLEEKVLRAYNNISDRLRKERIINETTCLSMEKAIEKLVKGQIESNTVGNLNEIFGLGLPWNGYQVILIEVPQFELDGVLASVKRVVSEFANTKDYGYVFEAENRIGMLTVYNSSDSSYRNLENLRKKIKTETGNDIIASVGKTVYDYKDIKISYKHAIMLLKKNFIFGIKGIITGEIEENENIIREVDEDRLISELCIAIDLNSLDTINNILEKIKLKYLSGNMNEQDIKVSYTKMFVNIVNMLNIKVDGYSETEILNESIFSEIYRKPSLQELHGFIKYKIFEISERLTREKPQSIMQKIINYIEKNYSKDIKLESLAQIVGYSSAYLGKLFKLNTGDYFNTYLDKVRLEKAKELLQEGLKVYEVSEKVGYCDIKYFHAKFKRHFGVSPATFKARRS